MSVASHVVSSIPQAHLYGFSHDAYLVLQPSTTYKWIELTAGRPTTLEGVGCVLAPGEDLVHGGTELAACGCGKAACGVPSEEPAADRGALRASLRGVPRGDADARGDANARGAASASASAVRGDGGSARGGPTGGLSSRAAG